ncbi:MAG: prepilin-type N-terminal cleavage/methylation domain-containing protein [Aquabacterium sp.]|jgi:type IV fimbrial biogenesis protein FimT|nr:MAG: prepilin-type N-terminal cleavage/methylation domain-containing protein [Aquabacterium sp.]TAL20846.1 MAG: prepilin-type N-terminal cleavage/methylation domain-containing protein [Aquabacterium sp.]
MGAPDHTSLRGMRRAPLLHDRHHGFTLIELLVTIAIVGVLLGLAAPALREFVAKNKVAGISNEFNAAILRARGEAIRQNTCVSMCISTSTQNAAPACSPAETDWQKGWLLFVNKSCDATTPAATADILQARSADQAQYTMTASTPIVTFTAQGRVRGQATTFGLRDAGDTSTHYGRDIVLSLQGRTTIAAPAPPADN